jgi:hypothetical protein
VTAIEILKVVALPQTMLGWNLAVAGWLTRAHVQGVCAGHSVGYNRGFEHAAREFACDNYNSGFESCRGCKGC